MLRLSVGHPCPDGQLLPFSRHNVVASNIYSDYPHVAPLPSLPVVPQAKVTVDRCGPNSESRYCGYHRQHLGSSQIPSPHEREYTSPSAATLTSRQHPSGLRSASDDYCAVRPPAVPLPAPDAHHWEWGSRLPPVPPETSRSWQSQTSSCCPAWPVGMRR